MIQIKLKNGNTLQDLYEQAEELINCGNSKEQSEGYGMKRILLEMVEIDGDQIIPITTKTVWENCCNCGNDVEILSNQIDTCPICGEVILPCAMCEDGINCNTECPYAHEEWYELAVVLNKQNSTELTIVKGSLFDCYSGISEIRNNYSIGDIDHIIIDKRYKTNDENSIPVSFKEVLKLHSYEL